MNRRDTVKARTSRLQGLPRCAVSFDCRRAGFTLVELMVALALAAILSMTIMIISNTAREIYSATSKKVETSNRFRLALLTLDRDFSQWIATMNLEFFTDGRGSGARKNKMWDEGEQLPDTRDELGPGVVDGGVFDEYDEYATVTERYYMAVGPGLDPEEDSNWRRHAAFQAYFRTMTYIDGKVREANVEYMLIDPIGDADRKVRPGVPERVRGAKVSDLVLTKIVRYHEIEPSQLFKQKNFPVKRRRVEIYSNVTDFKIEYTVENRFNSRVGLGFMVPSQEFDEPAERDVRPVRIRGGELPIFRKTFGYGSNKLDVSFRKATAFRARQGDRQPSGDHRGVRFGWTQGSGTQFAELVQGSSIFIFREGDRGGPKGSERTGGADLGSIGNLNSGLYSVRTIVGGQLEFYQDIDSTMWRGDLSGVLYKAAYLPVALRLTLRVVDDKGLNPKTLQRVIWIRRKAR